MTPQLKHYYKKKDELINILGGKCVVCGTNKKLQFHHKDKDTKKYTITAIYSSPKKLAEELPKCELRCEEHHKEIHIPLHGKLKRGCKCEKCLSHKRNYARNYKLARKHHRLVGKDIIL